MTLKSIWKLYPWKCVQRELSQWAEFLCTVSKWIRALMTVKRKPCKRGERNRSWKSIVCMLYNHRKHSWGRRSKQNWISFVSIGRLDNDQQVNFLSCIDSYYAFYQKNSLNTQKRQTNIRQYSYTSYWFWKLVCPVNVWETSLEFSNWLLSNLVDEMKKQKALFCKFGCYEVSVAMATRANTFKNQNVNQVFYGWF